MKQIYTRILIFCMVFGIAMQIITTKEDVFADDIVRLHIIANSDSQLDQSVKLMVRDKILEYAKVTGKVDINLEKFDQIANQTLNSQNITYRAKSEFGIYEFDQRSYGNVTLPRGNYKAVRILLGSGEGKNWWCVMYPPLCFVDKSTAKIDDLSMLSQQTQEKIEFKLKFKFLEMFK